MASTTCSASRYSACRDCSRGRAIWATSPYRPHRTAKALAMPWGIVDLGTRSVEVNQGKRPTIAHVPTGSVHGLPRAEGDFEKVPNPCCTQTGVSEPTKDVLGGH